MKPTRTARPMRSGAAAAPPAPPGARSSDASRSYVRPGAKPARETWKFRPSLSPPPPSSGSSGSSSCRDTSAPLMRSRRNTRLPCAVPPPRALPCARKKPSETATDVHTSSAATKQCPSGGKKIATYSTPACPMFAGRQASPSHCSVPLEWPMSLTRGRSKPNSAKAPRACIARMAQRVNHSRPGALS